MYLDEKGKANTDLSQNGRLAVGVSWFGFWDVLHASKIRKLPMSVLIQPAIDLAQKVLPLQKEKNLLNETREDFLKHNSHPTAFTKDIPWKKEIF